MPPRWWRRIAVSWTIAFIPCDQLMDDNPRPIAHGGPADYRLPAMSMIAISSAPSRPIPACRQRRRPDGGGKECVGGVAMKYLLWTSAALLLAISQPPPAQAQSARDLVNQAIAAQGGADALRALKALSIKADATHTEPGQSTNAGARPPL